MFVFIPFHYDEHELSQCVPHDLFCLHYFCFVFIKFDVVNPFEFVGVVTAVTEDVAIVDEFLYLELMLIIMEGDKNEQPATVLKNSLNIKYLWKQGLSDNHLKCKQKRKLLCSATKIGDEHSRQVETATYVCNLIMCELDCIEDTTTEILQFLHQAKDVAKGIIWN